jgi:epoxyqueuosine reductase
MDIERYLPLHKNPKSKQIYKIILVLQCEIMNSTAEKYSQLIKAKGKSFGFQNCGISKADF